MSENDILRMENISKSFPGVKALSDVNLTVRKGPIHALMGENGAGKSTLMKILDGIYTPDSGQIIFQEQPVTIDKTQTALKLGISMIHQELSPIPHMTVAERVVDHTMRFCVKCHEDRKVSNDCMTCHY